MYFYRDKKAISELVVFYAYLKIFIKEKYHRLVESNLELSAFH